VALAAAHASALTAARLGTYRGVDYGVVSQTKDPLKLTQERLRVASQLRVVPVPQQGWPIAAPHALQLSAAPFVPATQANPVLQVPAPNGPPGPPPPVRGQQGWPSPPHAWQVRGVAVGQ
jgi:hypothetical protein